MVVRREYLCESVSHLELAIEANLFWNGAIEGHQEAWICVVMLRDWRVVIILETRPEHFFIDTSIVLMRLQSDSLTRV